MKNIWIISFSCAIWNIATQFIIFAVPLIIFRETNSPSLVGLAFVGEWSLLLLVFPFIGYLIDKYGAKNVSLIISIIRVISCFLGIICALLFDGNALLISLVVIAALMTMCTGILDVAIDTLIPFSVDKKHLAKSQSLYQSSEMLGFMVGPLLSALLVKVISIEYLFSVSLIAFSFCFLMLNFVHPKRITQNNESNPISSFITGFKLLVMSRELVCFSLLNFTLNILFGYLLSIVPIVILQGFNSDDSTIGIVRGVAAISGIIGLFLIAKASNIYSIKSIGLWCWTAIPIACFLFAIFQSESILIYTLMYSLLMVIVQCHNVFSRTERIRYIPEESLGKVLTIFHFVSLSAMPIGGLLLSVFSDLSQIGYIVSMIGTLLMFLVIYSYKSIYTKVLAIE